VGGESVSRGAPSVTVERVPPHGSVFELRLAEADLDVRGEMFVAGEGEDGAFFGVGVEG